jgi:peptidoglycan/LPS O-acetylase OafA/YrhL
MQQTDPLIEEVPRGELGWFHYRNRGQTRIASLTMATVVREVLEMNAEGDSLPAASKPRHKLHPKYRPDIDGLRAIAVLSVLGFHAAPGRVAGGFIGVDVFFVISGFLISSILFSNLEHDTFSILDFYNRRIRRIFPALTAVMLASLAFGWLALTSYEYSQLGKHIAGGAGFVSNFLLYNESGYFDSAAEAKPMLHLWSLAIEEQFYIFWPLMLAFVWKRNWSFLRLTAAIGALSFAVNLLLTSKDLSAAFYWPISRFWELMIGGALAYLTLHKPEVLRKHKNAQSVAGFALLAIGLLLINGSKPFPSWWALLPTVSAFFIISAGPDAWLNRHVLSNKAMVGIGLISYPLYLWHWPLLTFARIVEGGEISGRFRIAILLFSFLISWITYRVVERPFKYKNVPDRRIALAVSLIVCVGVFGISCYANGGFTRRSTQPQILHAGDIGHEEFLKRFHEYPPCQIDKTKLSSRGLAGLTGCRQSVPDQEIEFAVMGDSHAAPLFIGLASALERTNVAVFSGDGLPLAANKEFESSFEYVLNDEKIRTVILVAHWSGRIGSADTAGGLENQLNKTVDSLEGHNKRVFVTNDNPDFRFDPSRCKYSGRLGLTNICTQDEKLLRDQLAVYEPILESVMSKHPQSKLLQTAELFCRQNHCSMENDGLLLFRDYQHLNLNGSKFLGAAIQKQYFDQQR